MNFTAYIPSNLEENGGLLKGLIGKRNAVDLGIASLIVFLVFKYGFFFLGAYKIILGIIVEILVGSIMIIGINGLSVSETIGIAITHNINKGKCTLLKPHPVIKEVPKKEKRKRSKKHEEDIVDSIDNIDDN